MKMFRLIYLFTLVLTFNLFPQGEVVEREGTVTFISSQYIYVKFEEMDGTIVGDTLYIKSKNKLEPILRIEFISSKSCAGNLLNGKELKVNDKVIAVAEAQIENEIEKEKPPLTVSPIQTTHNDIPEKNTSKQDITKKSEFNGRFAIQSHSNFSNYPGSLDYQRWRYTLSLNAKRIAESDLSFNSYINFNYKADDWRNISNDIWRYLKIYDMAFKYEFNESSNLFFGRHRNRNISNVGPIDGLQFEKRFNDCYAGAVIGFRPDFTDLNFNFDLLEYGGYLGRSDTIGDGVMDNNIAFMQQTNNSKTDRRFIYLQHTNNILENTSFFASSEIDLYKKIMEVESNELIFTSIFFSVRYSPARFFSASLSYDARKNVIYYETYKNFIDSLFENETRQGLNLRTSFRLTNSLFLGLNSGYRFRNGDTKPTRNFGGYLSYSAIPFIESSVAFNYNKLFTNYVESSVYGVRISKNVFNNFGDISFSYRRSQYDLTSSNFSSTQNIFSIETSIRINHGLNFTISYEGVFEERNTSGRIFGGITTKF